MGKVESIRRTDPDDTETMPTGAYLKRKMNAAGIKSPALARDLEVNVQNLYYIFNGDRSISANMALRLSRRFPEPPEFWLTDHVTVPVDISRHETPLLPLSAHNRAEPLQARLTDREIKALLERPDVPLAIAPYDPRNVEDTAYALGIGLVIESGFEELSEQEWLLVLELAHAPKVLHREEHARVAAKLKSLAGTVAYSKQATLDRLQSAWVLVRESLNLGPLHLGHVENRAFNAARGLMIGHDFETEPDSPGIFTTVFNMGPGPVRLNAGDRILNLAITRLAEPTSRAVSQDTVARIRTIKAKLHDALGKIFEYTPMHAGEFKAGADKLGLTVVGDDRGDAEQRAVSECIDALKSPRHATEDALAEAVRNALEWISLDGDDTRALIRALEISNPVAINEAEHRFRKPGSKQTVYDTVVRLQLDPSEFVIRLMEDTP